MIILLTLLAATPPAGFTAVTTDDVPALCGKSAERFFASRLICERKSNLDSLQVRPTHHAQDSTWTVRMDVATFSAADAKSVRAKLGELSAKRQFADFLLSWCPRSYIWLSSTTLLVASANCGGKKPLCELTRTFAPKTPGTEPWAIFGYEGGDAVLVRDEFTACENNR